MGLETKTIEGCKTMDMTRIEDFPVHDFKHVMGGVQAVFKFENGYGASVINHSGSYGTELAVLEFKSNGKFDLTYSTPITNDVIGHIEDAHELRTLLASIRALPNIVKAVEA